MATTNSNTEKGTVRPPTIILGIDECGREHVFRTTTDTIHVVNGTRRDATIPRDGRDLEGYMFKVKDLVGWADARYGVLAHRKDTVPPKWAGRR